MAITYSFVDGVSYGVQDINGIVGSLVGAGIAPFLTKASYKVSDLNALTGAIVEKGVQLEGCKCTVSDAGTQNISVFVNQGIVFFTSGARLEVDDQGYTVLVTPNTAGYIYAYYNSALQTADILFREVLPEDGEFVELAQITVEGELKDKRNFARSKIGTIGTNVTMATKFTVLDEPVLYQEEGSFVTYILARVENVNLSKYNFAHVCTDGVLGGSNTSKISGFGEWTAFLDINDGTIKYGLHDGNVWAANCLYYISSTTRYILNIIDGELSLLVRCYKNDASSAIKRLRECTVTFM